MARRCAASSGATLGPWKVRRKRSGLSASKSALLPSSSSALCPSPCSTASSMPSIRRGCSGTGGASFLPSSQTRPSRCTWSAVFVGVDPDPDNNERIISWTKEYWDAVHPHSGGGSYVNFMMDEGQERVKATYRDNFEKLVAIKNKYDPTNLFRVNQNIRPTATV